MPDARQVIQEMFDAAGVWCSADVVTDTLAAAVGSDGDFAVVDGKVVPHDATAAHRVGLLGNAIGEFLVAAGVTVDAPMTGPEVLAHLEQVTADLRAGAVRLVPPVEPPQAEQ